MAINGIMYKNDIRLVLKAGGPMKVATIKAKLESRGVKLDETQILEGLESLTKNRVVTRSEGKFALVTVL